MRTLRYVVAVLLVALVLGTLALRAGASVDSWSGKAEVIVPFSVSVTSGTSAVVCTATTDVAWNVRACTITDSASGVVTLYSGPTTLGAAVIGHFGVLANTPLKLTEDDLGQGIITTKGAGLYVSGATGTITITARVRKDPVGR